MPDMSVQGAAAAADLVEAIQQVFRVSDQPLTPAKVRAALPASLRSLPAGHVAETLERQAAAQVLFVFPKYRSQHDRYWDRPMRDHVEALLRRILENEPLSRSELRRRLPAYARILADAVLNEMLAQGRMHAHPAAGRSGPRFGLSAADPRVFMRPELEALFARLQRRGFARAALREAALGILQQEEWGPDAGSVPEPGRADLAAMIS
jgi:hypothetical protein